MRSTLWQGIVNVDGSQPSDHLSFESITVVIPVWAFDGCQRLTLLVDTPTNSVYDFENAVILSDWGDSWLFNR